MIDYQPLAASELEYLKRSDQRILRRAAAEIRIHRAGRAPGIINLAVMVLVVVALGVMALALARPGREPKTAAPIGVCSRATEQLRMARTFLQRARPGDVDDALLIVAAIAPTAGYCRDDDAVFHALERAARGGDRARALALVEAVLRSDR
jgi:hypothetical protein